MLLGAGSEFAEASGKLHGRTLGEAVAAFLRTVANMKRKDLTAAQAGNSPAMIHARYKGLATKTEAEKWFNVFPAKSAENVIPLPAAVRSGAR